MWEHFRHGADIGVRGYGATLEEAFAEAAVALTAVISEPAGVRPRVAIEIRCEAPDHELLLADWLNALIYEMATRSMLFARFQVRIEDDTLSARVWGEPVEVSRHQPAVEVKGATYTLLAIARAADGTWMTQAVVDV